MIEAAWLAVEKLTIEGSETEEHLIVTAFTDSGRKLKTEEVRRLFDVPATIDSSGADVEPPDTVHAQLQESRESILSDLASRQANWFDQEIDKFDRWAEDQRHSLRGDLKDLDAHLKDLKKQARTSGSLPDKLALQRKIKGLESKRDEAWRAYDNSSRDVETKKDDLLDQVEGRLKTEKSTERLFTVRWGLV